MSRPVGAVIIFLAAEVVGLAVLHAYRWYRWVAYGEALPGRA